MKKLFIIAFMLVISSTAYAGFTSGNELISYYLEDKKLEGTNRRVNAYEAGNYNGYVTGVADELFSKRMICPPSNVTLGQIKKIVGKYLTEHPEQLHLGANILILRALVKPFPCKK